MQIVAPFLTFPSVGWWLQVADCDSLMLDGQEHFLKMTERNRYRISGANNSILLTVPMVQGRDQRMTMAGIHIDNAQRWQVQHWRTLVSVYNRSPYFMHYEPSLSKLYTNEFTLLTDFNCTALDWVMKQLQLKINITETTSYMPQYPVSKDLRGYKCQHNHTPEYHQIFIDRHGFIPGLSILDLLFSEGPAAGAWLRANTPNG
jgi:hypothetical protein